MESIFLPVDFSVMYSRLVLVATVAYAILPSAFFAWLHYNSRKVKNSAICLLANSFSTKTSSRCFYKKGEGWSFQAMEQRI